MIKCVLFDFGDTLALSSDARKKINFVELGWELFKKHGFSGTYEDYVKARDTSSERYRNSGSKRYESGYLYKLVAEDAGWNISLEECAEMDAEYHDRYIEKVELDPHGVEILKYLKSQGIKTILLSNGHERNVMPVLKRYNAVELFDKIMISYEIGNEKSELSPFKQALSEFNLKPEEVIMIGDRKDEDMYAKKLGIHTVKIKREFEHLKGEPIEPDFEITDLLDLKDIVNKLNKASE